MLVVGAVNHGDIVAGGIRNINFVRDGVHRDRNGIVGVGVRQGGSGVRLPSMTVMLPGSPA